MLAREARRARARRRRRAVPEPESADDYWKRLKLEAEKLGVHPTVGMSSRSDNRDLEKLQRVVWDAKAQRRDERAEGRAKKQLWAVWAAIIVSIVSAVAACAAALAAWHAVTR